MNKTDKLVKRSFDQGLRYEYQGSFKTDKELKNLLTKTILGPTKIAQKLKDANYYENRLYLIDNKLYKILSNEDIQQLFDEFIYDINKCNFLLAFSSSNKKGINSAIDLHTGTIGQFDPKNQTYTPIKDLNSSDIDLLQDIADTTWFEQDIKSKDDIKRITHTK